MTDFDASIYDARFYETRGRQHHHYRKYAQCLLDLFGPFRSVLDLGAGNGYFAHVFSEAGAEAHMVELSEAVLPYVFDDVECRIHDLREPLDYGRTFELVLCIEVAEHLPESAADALCGTIARHVGRLLVFTSAPPGQGGDGHINCQPGEYWKEKLAGRGLTFAGLATDRLKTAWARKLEKQHQHLGKNVQVWIP